MTQPQRPAQPIDPAVRAGDESSVVGAQQATPAWESTGVVETRAAPARSPLLTVMVGTLVAERYEIVQALGEGGMGLVFRAKDRKLRRDLVLKFIRPDLVHQPGMIERLCAEAEAAAALNHPHVVTLHNRESDPHGEFLIMEFVDGPNLLQLLHQAGGKLSVERAVRYIGQVGSALQAAHDAGILHRDVKPSNVLINKSDVAKLADFGLARIVEESGQTKSGAVLGTLDYMAPEQLRDARLASPHSDQFSLAAMLYQLVVGNSPLRIRERDIPAELCDVLLRAVEDQPQKRFPSVAEFIKALPGARAAEGSRLSSDARHVGHDNPADLAKEFARLHAAAKQQSVEARQAFEQHDYEQAAKIGGQIPEELRDGQLLRDAIAKRDRVVELDRVIREATPAMKLAVLRPALDELLQLQPTRPDMQRLKEEVVRLTPALLMRPAQPLPIDPASVDQCLMATGSSGAGVALPAKLKRVASTDLMPSFRDVIREIETNQQFYFIQTSSSDSTNDETGFVMGPPAVLNRVFGLFDAEYGWPSPMRLDAITTVDALAPSYRRHPVVCRGKEQIAICVSLSEFTEIDRVVSRDVSSGAGVATRQITADTGSVGKGLICPGTKAGERMAFKLNGIKYAFRWCPAGQFTMGSPKSEKGRDDNETQMEVELTRGYWMQETLVTQGMWQSVMGSGLDWGSYGKGPRHPVYNVNHGEALKFCETLNGALQSAVVAGVEVRLPSEAEWEYACRAGTRTRYYWGDEEGKLDGYAWHSGNSNGGTHPVGEKKPNGWGLFDMSGLLWEWCGDWYAEKFVGGRDPQGASSGSYRCLRGRSWWHSGAGNFRSAGRSRSTPSFRVFNMGFRMAAVPAAK